LNNTIELDEKRGEVRLLGLRQMIIDMDALCNHLDTLVGSQVAEVIIKNLELQEGKEEAKRFLRNHPGAKVQEFIELMKRYDALSGVGITSVKFSEHNEDPILIEISNPYIKRTSGSSKSLLFSWWCGVLSGIFHREFDLESITYDAGSDVLKCTITSRAINQDQVS
jgi:hypothetical protein